MDSTRIKNLDHSVTPYGAIEIYELFKQEVKSVSQITAGLDSSAIRVVYNHTCQNFISDIFYKCAINMPHLNTQHVTNVFDEMTQEKRDNLQLIVYSLLHNYNIPPLEDIALFNSSSITETQLDLSIVLFQQCLPYITLNSIEQFIVFSLHYCYNESHLLNREGIQLFSNIISRVVNETFSSIDGIIDIISRFISNYVFVSNNLSDNDIRARRQITRYVLSHMLPDIGTKIMSCIMNNKMDQLATHCNTTDQTEAIQCVIELLETFETLCYGITASIQSYKLSNQLLIMNSTQNLNKTSSSITHPKTTSCFNIPCHTISNDSFHSSCFVVILNIFKTLLYYINTEQIQWFTVHTRVNSSASHQVDILILNKDMILLGSHMIHCMSALPIDIWELPDFKEQPLYPILNALLFKIAQSVDPIARQSVFRFFHYIAPSDTGGWNQFWSLIDSLNSYSPHLFSELLNTSFVKLLQYVHLRTITHSFEINFRSYYDIIPSQCIDTIVLLALRHENMSIFHLFIQQLMSQREFIIQPQDNHVQEVLRQTCVITSQNVKKQYSVQQIKKPVIWSIESSFFFKHILASMTSVSLLNRKADTRAFALRLIHFVQTYIFSSRDVLTDSSLNQHDKEQTNRCVGSTVSCRKQQLLHDEFLHFLVTDCRHHFAFQLFLNVFFSSMQDIQPRNDIYLTRKSLSNITILLQRIYVEFPVRCRLFLSQRVLSLLHYFNPMCHEQLQYPENLEMIQEWNSVLIILPMSFISDTQTIPLLRLLINTMMMLPHDIHCYNNHYFKEMIEKWIPIIIAEVLHHNSYVNGYLKCISILLTLWTHIMRETHEHLHTSKMFISDIHISSPWELCLSRLCIQPCQKIIKWIQIIKLDGSVAFNESILQEGLLLSYFIQLMKGIAITSEHISQDIQTVLFKAQCLLYQILAEPFFMDSLNEETILTNSCIKKVINQWNHLIFIVDIKHCLSVISPLLSHKMMKQLNNDHDGMIHEIQCRTQQICDRLKTTLQLNATVNKDTIQETLYFFFVIISTTPQISFDSDTVWNVSISQCIYLLLYPEFKIRDAFNYLKQSKQYTMNISQLNHLVETFINARLTLLSSILQGYTQQLACINYLNQTPILNNAFKTIDQDLIDSKDIEALQNEMNLIYKNIESKDSYFNSEQNFYVVNETTCIPTIAIIIITQINTCPDECLTTFLTLLDKAIFPLLFSESNDTISIPQQLSIQLLGTLIRHRLNEYSGKAIGSKVVLLDQLAVTIYGNAALIKTETQLYNPWAQLKQPDHLETECIISSINHLVVKNESEGPLTKTLQYILGLNVQVATVSRIFILSFLMSLRKISCSTSLSLYAPLIAELLVYREPIQQDASVFSGSPTNASPLFEECHGDSFKKSQNLLTTSAYIRFHTLAFIEWFLSYNNDNSSSNQRSDSDLMAADDTTKVINSCKKTQKNVTDFCASLISIIIIRLRSLQEEAEKSKVPALPNTASHRFQIRFWQALCCISMHTTRLADAMSLIPSCLLDDLWNQLKNISLPDVRHFMELFFIRSSCATPMLSFSRLSQGLDNLNASTQITASYIIISGYFLYFFVQDIPGRSIRNDDESRLMVYKIIDAMLLHASSHSALIRAATQGVVLRVFSQPISELYKPIPLRVSALLRYVQENKEAIKMQKRINAIFSAWEPRTEGNILWLLPDTKDQLEINTWRDNKLIFDGLDIQVSWMFMSVLKQVITDTASSAMCYDTTGENQHLQLPEPVTANPTVLDSQDYQKKFNPTEDNNSITRNRNDINSTDILDRIPFDTLKERGSSIKRSSLIVAASLINKIPNLAGLTRTCEVLGAERILLPSLAVTRDNLFQACSVCSHLWMPTSEVPPSLLYHTLMTYQQQGYTLVALEQTKHSILLNEATFPKLSILIVGTEKEGIPLDILSLVDYAIEIPQSGMTRSLNVHVAASLAIWKYNEQHPL